MKYTVFAFTAAAALTSTASAVTMTVSNVSGGAIVTAGTYSVGVVGTTSNVNNWPGAEAPAGATDGSTATKYLNFFKLNTGIVVTPTGGSAAFNLNSLTFSTANDSPDRDPLTFTLYGSSTALGNGNITLSTLTLISADHTTGLDTDPGRLTTVAPQTFTNNTAYASYLLVFPTVRNATTANSMQVSDIAFASVPEPGTTALAGLALLGLARRRR